jgi:hypothetical protein
MTTGRINQVTIFGDPLAGAIGSNPNKLASKGRPAFDSPQALAFGLPSGHPIAITGFPKVRSAVERAGIRKDAARPRHAYLKRRLPAASHVRKDGYRCAGMPPIAS